MKAVVGKIVKPQGVKGEIKVEPLVPNEECFRGFKKVFIDDKQYVIENIRVHQGFVYLFLQGVNDRNIVEKMRNKKIEIDKEDLPKLEDKQYYIADLEECVVYFENGDKAGKIVEVNNYGASDILTIMDGTEEILCPFLPYIFTEVDVKNKRIVANKERFIEITEGEI